MSEKHKILQPETMRGRENGCVLVADHNGVAIELHVVGRDATRLLSVLLPNLSVSDLISIRNTAMAEISRRT